MTTNTGSADLPRWNFNSIEPHIDAQKKEATERIASLPALLDEGESIHAAADSARSLAWLAEVIEANNRITGLLNQLFSYSYCRYSIETGNPEWVKLLNSMEALAVPLNGYHARFVNILDKIFKQQGLSQDNSGVEKLLEMAESNSGLHDYAYYIEQSLEIARYRMAPELGGSGR